MHLRQPAPENALRVGGLSVGALVAVVIGVVLRCWHLGANRLGFDEAFTAMAGRRSFGSLVAYLRVRDSHPPLDYLLRSPLSRAGVPEIWLRLPSVVCSIAAVALLGWWLRRTGWVGIVAAALMACSSFEVTHGRDARMYADLQLLGVVAAVVAAAWLARPQTRHAVLIGTLVAVGLLIHTSMFLFAAGLFVLAGRRRDRDAWRWRGAIVAGFLVWAAAWGPAFVEQSQGGHSSWIPRTTFSGAIETVGRLVLADARWDVVILAGVLAGALTMARLEPRVARVVICCSFVPIGLAIAAGVFLPVLLDRTLTLMAWGPMVALAFLVRALPHRWGARCLIASGLTILVFVMAISSWREVSSASVPDRVVRHLERVVRPGDLVALRPSGRLHLLEWSLGVRTATPYRTTTVVGVPDSAALELGGAHAIGSSRRLWLLDWADRHLSPAPVSTCAPVWHLAQARLSCLEPPVARPARPRDGARSARDLHRQALASSRPDT